MGEYIKFWAAKAMVEISATLAIFLIILAAFFIYFLISMWVDHRKMKRHEEQMKRRREQIKTARQTEHW